MGVRKKFDTSGSGGDGRNERTSWKFVAGAVIFLLVTGVPAAIAWLQGHEMACGWSPGWQRFAGWFGDCAVYAQKPTQVIVTGPLAPQTKGDLYRFGLKRFRESVDQVDKDEFDKLFAEGWRVQTKDACNILADRSRNAGSITPFLVITLDRFSKERISCDGLDGPVFILSRGPHCWRDFSKYASMVSAIDAWMQINPSPELRDVAQRLLKAFQTAESASQSQIEKLCVARHSNVKIVDSLGRSEDGFADAVFSFSKFCKASAYEGYPFGARIGSLAGVYTYHGLSRAQESVTEECRSNTKQIGVDPKAMPIKEFLVRWAK